MSKINIVVVGAGMYVCGRGTDGYGTIMPAVCEWSKINDIGEVGIAGRSRSGVNDAKKKIERLQTKMGTSISIRYFSDRKDNIGCYLEAIRNAPRPACAIIAVPDNLHGEVAAAAIKAGLHTLVVKPLVPTVREAQKLIRLQERKNVYCAVEFHKRFDYANLKLKDAIKEGIIGDPLYFLAEFSQRKSMPTLIFKRWVESTNIFQYLGIHYVDIIYFATKATPKRAMAVGQKTWLRSKRIDAYDSIEAVIEWETPGKKKFVSHILTNWVDPEATSAMSDQKIKVIGTKGRFESDQKKRGITIVTDDKGLEEPNPYFCSGYGETGSVSYRGYGIDSIHRFLNDVSNLEDGLVGIDELEKDRATFRDSLVPTKALEAVNKSLNKGGEWVEID